MRGDSHLTGAMHKLQGPVPSSDRSRRLVVDFQRLKANASKAPAAAKLTRGELGKTNVEW